MTVKITVFCDVTPYNMVDSYQSEGACCLHLQVSYQCSLEYNYLPNYAVTSQKAEILKTSISTIQMREALQIVIGREMHTIK
jgi:tagatose-1,6-bisphosphate aldolase non-catalytic subunit AgaZ/GatZ